MGACMSKEQPVVESQAKPIESRPKGKEAATNEPDGASTVESKNEEVKQQEAAAGGNDEAVVVKQEFAREQARTRDAEKPKAAPTKLTPKEEEERDAKMKKMFDLVDKDNSGSVDTGELKVILEKLNLKVDPENLAFLLARYDDDNSGILNFEEFRELALSILEVKKQFAEVDADHSGACSEAEMLAFMSSKKISTETAKQIINIFDEDRNGDISYNEFLTFAFYLNELEYQHAQFQQEQPRDYTWVIPLLGADNSAKAPEVVKELKAMSSHPTLEQFIHPIIRAAKGQKGGPIRIKALRTRVAGPPKKTMAIPKTEVEMIKADGLFCDPDFVPSVNLVPETARRHIHSWKRISEFSSDAKLFENGVEEGDVIQGMLGDCWFLGALAVVATSTSNFIEHLFVQQSPQQGLYQCRFYKNGQWVNVAVDDRLPVDQWGRLIFASCKSPTEFWVPILEKAYAKLHGSYTAIEAGSIADGLKDLTGEGVEVTRLDGDEFKASPDKAWDMLVHHVKEGFMMGCAIDSNGMKAETELAGGLLAGHAYSVINCEQVNNHRLVRVRNPWGKGEWNGPWSDDSSEWTPALLKHFNYSFANDGTFFMSFEDYIQRYSRLYVLHVLGDDVGEKWTKHSFEGEWKGESAAGCANHGRLLDNPQYFIEIAEKDTRLFINLSQPDLRYTMKKSPTQLSKEYDAFGLYVLKAGHSKLRKTAFKPEDKVNASAFTNVRDLSYDCVLQPGHYVIVPCTFTPGVPLSFGFEVYTQKTTKMHTLTESMPSRSVQGAWAGASAGGCANHRATWLNNPQFLLVCSTPGEVDISLSQAAEPKKLDAICLYAFSSPEQHRLAVMGPLVLKPSQIINLATVTEKITVQANVNYIIIPTTFEPNKERKFTLTAASESAQFAEFKAL